MDKNRELHELLGLHWHKRITSRLCNCGFIPTGFEIIESHTSYNNPDYASDAGKVQLLRMMSKREDWYLFVHKIGKCNSGHFYSDYVEIDYIIGQTGKLRDAAWEWLRKEASDGCDNRQES